MVCKQQRKTIITPYIQEQLTIAAVWITADTNKSVDTIHTDQWLLWIFTNLVTEILHLTNCYGIILWLTLAWYVQNRKVCEKFLALFFNWFTRKIWIRCFIRHGNFCKFFSCGDSNMYIDFYLTSANTLSVDCD